MGNGGDSRVSLLAKSQFLLCISSFLGVLVFLIY